MLSEVAGKPLKVTIHNKAIAYIDLPASQMDVVSQLFTADNIPHWKDHVVISAFGGPKMEIIHLSRKANPHRAQEVLDAGT